MAQSWWILQRRGGSVVVCHRNFAICCRNDENGNKFLEETILTCDFYVTVTDSHKNFAIWRKNIEKSNAISYLLLLTVEILLYGADFPKSVTFFMNI